MAGLSPAAHSSQGDTTRDTVKANDDNGFKRFIRRKKILAWIIKLTIPEFRDVDVDAIVKGLPGKGNTAEMKNTVLTGEGSTSILDSLFSVSVVMDSPIPGDSGKRVIEILLGVEAQNDPAPDYSLDTRAQFYAASMLSGETHNRRYDLIPAHSVWLLPEPASKDRGRIEHLRMCRLQNMQSKGEPLNDSMINIVKVYMGTDGEDSENIFDFLAPYFTKDCRVWNNKEGFNDYMKRYKLEETDITIKEAKEMYGLYEDTKVRFMREGIEIGEERGRIDYMVKCCKAAMEDKGLTVDEAIEYAYVPPEYVEQVKAMLLGDCRS